MKELPIIKMEEINLTIVTDRALVTEIDSFRFTHKRGRIYITVEFQESEAYEWMDEIPTENIYLEEVDLERKAMNWIFNHVELVKK